MTEPHFTTKIEHFLAWFKHQGGWVHPSVLISYDALNGIYLKCSPSLSSSDGLPRPGEPVIRCPHHLSISCLNALGYVAEHGDHLKVPEALSKNGSPRLIGAAFLCVQYLLGTKSFWSPYLDILPRPRGSNSNRGVGEVDCPLYWSKPELTWLDDTNLQKGVADLNESWEIVWDQWSSTLIEWTTSIGLPGLDWALFKWALTIFGTRSFSPASIKHWRNSNTSQAMVDMQDPHSLLFPGIDLLNHCPRTANRWAGDATNFSITLNDTVKVGDEICNTYGCQNNAQLLLSWGFCLKDNPYDAFALKLLSESHVPLLKLINEARTETKDFEDELSRTESGENTTQGDTHTTKTSVRNEAIAAVLPLGEQTDFMAFDEEQGLFMVRDPVDVGDDDEYPPSDDDRLAYLHGFPEMLLARLAAQVANQREKQSVHDHPHKFSSTKLYLQLGSRNLLQLGELLREKLDITQQSLTLSSKHHSEQVKSLASLPPISKSRLQQAYVYRDGQIHILYTNARLLYQRVEDARSEPRSEKSTPNQLVDIRFLLDHLRAYNPAYCTEFIMGFGELAHDVAACAGAILEQGSEEVFTVSIIAAMERLENGYLLQYLGIIPQVLDWYIAQPISRFEDYDALADDVQQYATSMRQAFPDNRLWQHGFWDDTSFLTACAGFVVEETVTLAPHESGPQMLCTGPVMMGGV